MEGCKRTSLSRKTAPERKSLPGGREGRRTRLGRGAFQVPVPAGPGEQGGDAPLKASDSDALSIWTESSSANSPVGAGTSMTQMAKPTMIPADKAISTFLSNFFGKTIPVFPLDPLSLVT